MYGSHTLGRPLRESLEHWTFGTEPQRANPALRPGRGEHGLRRAWLPRPPPPPHSSEETDCARRSQSRSCGEGSGDWTVLGGPPVPSAGVEGPIGAGRRVGAETRVFDGRDGGSFLRPLSQVAFGTPSDGSLSALGARSVRSPGSLFLGTRHEIDGQLVVGTSSLALPANGPRAFASGTKRRTPRHGWTGRAAGKQAPSQPLSACLSVPWIPPGAQVRRSIESFTTANHGE